MNQIALLVAMTATSGLFGRPAATTCSGGSCGSAAYYNAYAYQPHYAYPYQAAPQTYTSHYYAPQQPAAPAVAPAQPQPAQGLRSVPATAPATATVAQPQPQPAAAFAPPVQAPAPVYYYYPAASPCAGGNCYRR